MSVRFGFLIRLHRLPDDRGVRSCSASVGGNGSKKVLHESRFQPKICNIFARDYINGFKGSVDCRVLVRHKCVATYFLTFIGVTQTNEMKSDSLILN